MEGNKIIAKFLGYEYVPYNQPIIDDYYVINPEGKKTFHTRNLVGWVNKAPVNNLKGIKSIGPPHVLCRNASQLSFHKTWNWVMKIVEAIEEKYPNININPELNYCTLKFHEIPSFASRILKCEKENKRLSTWAACVEALKIISRTI